VIIGRFVSLSGRRLAATLLALMGFVIASVGVQSASIPDSTWVALAPVPQQGHNALFALAVAPDNNQVLVAGNSQGSLFRSTDGGSTWKSVHAGRSKVLTIAFSPDDAAIVLAGTSGGGALASRDAGVTWAPATGLENRKVHVFGFALTVYAAGTDRGVYLSQDGFAWTQSGMTDGNIIALAVAAKHPPVRLIAGGDTSTAGATVPMFQSVDAGATWTPMNPAISGAEVARLAAGPLPPTGNVRPLVVGTNTGLFESSDNGATFSLLSGSDVLPSTDYTEAMFVTTHYDRFYVASDGGGSNVAGLWSTPDAGQHFTALVPPIPSVTALAVSNDEAPLVYIATFRPSDHLPSLWVYHDTGGNPQGPGAAPTASGSRTQTNNANQFAGLFSVLGSPQTPYVALGIVALAVLLFAVISHLRGRRG
jgi:photosystem II stability/assembly factor-like uncharacterized protein